MTVAIELTDEQERTLREAVRDLVGQTGADFEAAASRVMEKNSELYKRLA